MNLLEAPGPLERRTFFWPHPFAVEARRPLVRVEVEAPPRDRWWMLGLIIGPFFGWLCWCVSRRRWAWASLALSANIALWVGGGFVLGELGIMLRAASGQ